MGRKINEGWTAYVVGRMHRFNITHAELAERCGYTPTYISMVLNGKKRFKTIESKDQTKARILKCTDELVRDILGGRA